MNDWEKWRERVWDIRADGTTWWWWWWYPLCVGLFQNNSEVCGLPKSNFCISVSDLSGWLVRRLCTWKKNSQYFQNISCWQSSEHLTIMTLKRFISVLRWFMPRFVVFFMAVNFQHSCHKCAQEHLKKENSKTGHYKEIKK